MGIRSVFDSTECGGQWEIGDQIVGLRWDVSTQVLYATAKFYLPWLVPGYYSISQIAESEGLHLPETNRRTVWELDKITETTALVSPRPKKQSLGCLGVESRAKSRQCWTDDVDEDVVRA